MDGILKVQFSVSDFKHFNVYKKSLVDHQSLALTKQNEPILQLINQKLGTSPQEGLELLKFLLQQCSLELIEQKSSSWIPTCIKICNHNKKECISSLSYDVLGILIKKSIHTNELNKSFSGNYIAKVCETLAVNPTLSALKCLFLCLQKYPGPCGGPSRNLIEQYLINNFVDCVDINLVRWSGKCFHLLQQVRGGGVQGISHKASWKVYQSNLLGTLHSILDELFTNCPEYYEFEGEKNCLTLNPLKLSNDPVIRTAELFTRFKNLINFLLTAIRDPYPVTKAIQPKYILNLITRGLSITCDILKRNNILDNIALGAVMPNIHLELYKLLDTLMLTIKSYMNIFHEQILGLIIDTLKWTSSGKSSGFQKPYSELRVKVYNTLSIWCKTMKFASCTEAGFEQIFKQIENDITPHRNEITLQVLSGTRKHMSKKARRQLHKVQNEKSHLGQTHMKSFDSKNAKVIYNDVVNSNVCFTALMALTDIYTYSSCFLKPSSVNEIHQIVLEICLSINEAQNSKSSIYSSSKCRQKLYDVLSCLIKAPNALCPPPTALIIQLLTIGQINDPNEYVRNCCSEHLLYLEKIIHSQKQCLYFPPDLLSIKNAFKIHESIDRDVSDSDGEHEVQDKLGNEELTILKIITPNNSEENIGIQNDIPPKIHKKLENTQKNLENTEKILEKSGKYLQTDENDLEKMDPTITSGQISKKENEKEVTLPKKRFHDLQSNSENEESSDLDISIKRIRTDSLDSKGKSPKEKNEEKTKISDENEDGMRNDESLFDEILATFTDELIDEMP